METQKKVAVIAGGASGLGRELVLELLTKGYKVFGTASSEGKINEFKKTIGDVDLTLTVCDITNEKDVQKWRELVKSSLGDQGVDLLIYNAGVLTPGPMEVLKLDAIRKEFEVNVFGSIAVTNTFLPLLRKSKGRIVQIGSMTGRFPLPFSGPSSASKATLEAFADVYRMELKPFGIGYTLVRPGNMLTGGPAKTAAQLQEVSENMTPDQKQLYGKYFDQFAVSLNKMQGDGLAATLAAKKIIEISVQIPVPSRANVGDDAEEILKMVQEKSDAELDNFRNQLLGFDKINNN